MEKAIVIKGAKEHNLKDLSLTIPRDRFVVLTGLSGSGKSSLAFDTIYAEGQRRYLESLSAYARQFLEQMRKPDVDAIEGLSPSISIEQKNISRNPRSTVGTVTEIYDFLRLLYARAGTPICPSCGKPIQSQTIQQIADQILSLPQSTKLAILAPIVRGKKGEYQKELLAMRSQGFVRALIDGEEVSLATPIKLQKSLKHDISIFIDRIVLRTGLESRLAEAIEIATRLSEGLAEVLVTGETERRFFSTKFACADCGTSFPEIEPRTFSFNSPHGACATCDGLGFEERFSPDRIAPDVSVSINEGALQHALEVLGWKPAILEAVAEKYKFKLDVPFKKLSEEAKHIVFYGSGKEEVEFKQKGKSRTHSFVQQFSGVIPALELKRGSDEEGEDPDLAVSGFLARFPCATCKGSRLRKEALCVSIGGMNIADLCALNVSKCEVFFEGLSLAKHLAPIAEPVLKEIRSRLLFLSDVGLAYLTLNRSAATLSGGEAQRIRLASQVGSNLVGVLYVLDEPSIGLHQRDNEKLIRTLEKLRDNGNSVLVVEHDEETILRADQVLDLGPGAGTLGGHLVFQGTPEALKANKDSLTGNYLSGRVAIELPEKRREGNGKRITIKGASLNNLKGVSSHIPLGTFTCVTGVSGSGKSSFILDTLLWAFQNRRDGQSTFHSETCEAIEGMEQIDKVVHVDQSPIGRTPRSNPATYTGLFTEIRALFAALPEAKARGYTASRFSFNVQGGRCEGCSGDGNIKISMHFLPDVFVACEVCRGKRYNRETLEVTYRGKSIADVLGMTVEDGHRFFERIPHIKTKLQTLEDVGLGYIQIGQSAVTLSGGEAQRIKLSKELNRRATGKTLYVLDEPTTGLHFEDVRKLLVILQLLVDQGNTVVVIEHNLDIIKQADFLIDLGPEGGDGGGQILFEGTPEALMKVGSSYTGRFLKTYLNRHENEAKARPKKNVTPPLPT